MNKKKQKNFLLLGRACVSATVPGEQKFFAPLFLKKRLLSCFQLNLSRPSDSEIQAMLERRMREVGDGSCRSHDTECSLEYTHEFAATVESEPFVDVAVRAAANVAGEELFSTIALSA